MEPILLILALATLGELIIEALKPGLDPLLARLNIADDINPYLYLSLALGIALAVVYRADIIRAAGLSEQITALGMLTTGLFLGRGANFIHDALTRLAGPGIPRANRP